ncbi:MAG: phosphoribosylformylglycinamidine synthase subunit PurL [Nitrososphaeraceae archaeon]
MNVLTSSELNYLIQKLGRKPNNLEKEIIGAEWSEHCSYKSSKKLIKLLPTKGDRIILGPGYDAGVLDVGDGYVVTIHLESHNHPSAVEPYGGAATGVGGVIRDIISMGTMPIAILNALRFGPINSSNLQFNKVEKNTSKKFSHSRWLLKNVVKGIADYGNCIGVPTVGGELEFDDSFENYCLVDVASIGLGRNSEIIENVVEERDLIILVGGLTGRDGIHGASFASKKLENDEDRSAVQIPDPFLEKLIMEATREAIKQNLVKAIKDLGGGGLSCCLSETSSNLGMGFEIKLEDIPTKYPDMLPSEIMISESQERMLFIIDRKKYNRLKKIFKKYELNFARIGEVKNHKDLIIIKDKKLIANMPSSLIAHAPLLTRISRKPNYLEILEKRKFKISMSKNMNSVLLDLISDPSIASKKWIYEQYDQEVGLRTILKPGITDSAILKLTEKKFLAAKLDGNSKLCYLNPFQGILSCLSESKRNIVCSGAEPIGIVDHLQFGNPENPNIFWTFKKSVEGIIIFSKQNNIPIVGGKVSFYNETNKGAIKPSPLIGMIGLIDNKKHITNSIPNESDSLFIIGNTTQEMGGSEYLQYIHGFTGSKVPTVDLKKDSLNSMTVLNVIREELISCAHDCSNGGLAIAVAEMAMGSKYSISIDLDLIPNNCDRLDYLLFSETPSRFIVGTKEPDKLERYLRKIRNLTFAKIGMTTKSNRSNGSNTLSFKSKNKKIIEIEVDRLRKNYDVIRDLMDKEN